MAFSPGTLRVLPNPYTYVDEDGQACGTCAMEAPIQGRWVGAEMASVELGDEPKQYAMIERRQKPSWKFASDAVVVPCTDYYKERVRHGDLICADAESFVKAGVRGDFEEPATLLAAERAKAIAHFKATHGVEPAFARPQIKAAPAAKGDPK